MQVPAELEKLLPVAQARPLEVAVVAPGEADTVVQALLASGADVAGEDGARAVMTGLAVGKRARVQSLLDCQVRFHFLTFRLLFCLSVLEITFAKVSCEKQLVRQLARQTTQRNEQFIYSVHLLM